MKTFASLTTALLLLASAASGQSVSKLISQANKALGGEKALKAITSQQSTGKITRLSDGATGRYRSSFSAGSAYSEAFDIEGFEYAAGQNGKSGWVRDSKNGPRTVTGEAARDFQAEAVFRNGRWLRAKDDKARLSFGGTAEIGGKPSNAVIITSAKGTRIKVYFDAVTGLPVQEEIPRGPDAKRLIYSNYRLVNGVQTPFTMRVEDGGESYRVDLEAISYNQPVPRTAYDFPSISGDPLPNIPTLLEEIKANTAKIDEILENYSYTETRIDRDLNSSGQFVEKDSEKRSFTFYKGHRIARTIEKNGKPLSVSDQANEDKEAQKQIAEIEKRLAERERKQFGQQNVAAKDQSSEPSRRITIADALKNSRLINPRRERFGGREVIVFDYEPDPTFKPKTQNEKIFAICNGAVWVDATTKQVVRLEATLMQSMGSFLAKAKRGASFTLENQLVNNEIWLPLRADISLQIKVLFAGININNLIKYGDYKRFETEVKDVRVGEDKKP